jgi:hypothetical protein
VGAGGRAGWGMGWDGILGGGDGNVGRGDGMGDGDARRDKVQRDGDDGMEGI